MFRLPVFCLCISYFLFYFFGELLGLPIHAVKAGGEVSCLCQFIRSCIVVRFARVVRFFPCCKCAYCEVEIIFFVVGGFCSYFQGAPVAFSRRRCANSAVHVRVFSVLPKHALWCPSIRLPPEYSFPGGVGSRVNFYPRVLSCGHLWPVLAYTAVRE